MDEWDRKKTTATTEQTIKRPTQGKVKIDADQLECTVRKSGLLKKIVTILVDARAVIGD